VIEIKEGIDLDRAIAGVIGLICTQRVLGSDIEFYVDPGAGTLAVPRTFKPSTNLNDAFHAAEKVELFPGRWLGTLVTGWTIMELHTQNVVGPEDGCSTPALAICAAILKVTALKGT
jgi:hypothetical protein